MNEETRKSPVTAAMLADIERLFPFDEEAIGAIWNMHSCEFCYTDFFRCAQRRERERFLVRWHERRPTK